MELLRNGSGAGRYFGRIPLRPANGWVAMLLVMGLAQVPASSGEEVGNFLLFLIFFSPFIMLMLMIPYDHDTHYDVSFILLIQFLMICC